ncbi:hypothetical protein BBJ28_00000277 [Nothophytophthora sp. Chile5]|nr:hypothetical protein BBJ28_00000277 [Nothophytophthora sp. Chile5]
MAEEYRQRLDNNVEKLVENFKGLLKTAKLPEVHDALILAWTGSVAQVQASESLLKLVSEMKLSVALGDFEGMSQNVDTTTEDLFKRSDISSALFELENHYYQSKWRLPPTTDDDAAS